ncbi:MAG: VOC family protein [Magnetococcales bacterium]|nr:VOC family protein [Magnetococcales bacterium]
MSLDAVGIISRDIDQSIAFYEILGLKFQEVGGPDHWEGVTESGIRIMLDSVELVKKLDPNWIESKGAGVVLCFKQESPIGVDEIYDRIVQAGFKGNKLPWNAFWGQRYASVKDPDGNQIDLFASL